MTAPRLAYDKRTIDQDGRLRVPDCRISKANVCPYYGREIPGYEALGLNPDVVYYLYRHPDELRKAAESFESIPLLRVHTPVTAGDHSPDDVVGVVANIRFEHPYLVGDVTVWTQEGIDYVTSEERKELSSAYRYVPVLGVGTSPEGLRYDLIMTNLLGNHVALVAEGRAGPDVVVADSAKGLPMKFRRTVAALASFLGATFTPSAQLAFDEALASELDAMDAVNELDDTEKKAACDAMCKELGKDSLDDDETREAYRRAAADKRAKDAQPGNASAPAAPEGGAPKPAADAALALDEAAITAKAREGYVLAVDHVTVTAATQLAADAATAVHALYTARDTVAEKVGLIALDGADAPKNVEAIYRKACDILKIEHAAVAADALPAFYKATVTAAALATDMAPAKPFDVLSVIPALSNIRKG
jgi:hypothetical protein